MVADNPCLNLSTHNGWLTSSFDASSDTIFWPPSVPELKYIHKNRHRQIDTQFKIKYFLNIKKHGHHFCIQIQQYMFVYTREMERKREKNTY